MEVATTQSIPLCRKCGAAFNGLGTDLCMRCGIAVREAERAALPSPTKRSVYHKTIRVVLSPEDIERGYAEVTVDVYRLLRLFGVTDHNLGHAIKKLLVPGQRPGGKSAEQDVAEAIWTLQRWEEMNREDKAAKP